MRMNSVVAAGIAAVFLGMPAAHAGLVTYTDPALWSAAVSGATTVTIPLPSSYPASDYFGTGDAVVVYDGVRFSTSAAIGNTNFFNVSPFLSGELPALSSQPVSGLGNILITFASPITAFSLNFGTFDGSDVTFVVSNHPPLPQSSTGGGYATPDFFGATDTTPFTTVLLTSPDRVLDLNNVSFLPVVTPVPELSTWAMLLLGFAGMGFFGYRRSLSKPLCL